MRKSVLFALVLIISFCSCAKSDPGGETTTTSSGINSSGSNNSSSNSSGRGTYNGHTLYRGPDGGCYYYNSNGNKTYVDRSLCN